mmetsp:Transcript_94908/g.306375  ORF Transcript_94908/g.306375 Transcript_94908/m.306375 type:complete len:202 (+) Transcript_94908:155-760(+)
MARTSAWPSGRRSGWPTCRCCRRSAAARTGGPASGGRACGTPCRRLSGRWRSCCRKTARGTRARTRRRGRSSRLRRGRSAASSSAWTCRRPTSWSSGARATRPWTRGSSWPGWRTSARCPGPPATCSSRSRGTQRSWPSQTTAPRAAPCGRRRPWPAPTRGRTSPRLRRRCCVNSGPRSGAAPRTGWPGASSLGHWRTMRP